MVSSQLVYEATEGFEVYESDEEREYAINTQRPLHVEDWSVYYSDELLNMWLNMRQYLQNTGLSTRILRNAELSDFIEFCYMFSDRRVGP